MDYENIAQIAKKRGIIYPSFEIYGGLGGFYDYGPIGTLIKNNIVELIRRRYVVDEECFEVECPVLGPEKIWIASGHVAGFSDMVVECAKCGEPYRADHLVEEKLNITCDGMSAEEIERNIREGKIRCAKCGGELGKPVNFNMMFRTEIGPGKYKQTGYLRPETAQTTYLSFKRLWEITRKKLPFGVLQIGRSFRNEISTRKWIIRLREFNQAEIQFFTDPENKTAPRLDEVGDIKVLQMTKDGKEFGLTLKESIEKGIIKNQLIAYLLGKSINLFAEMGMDVGKMRIRQHKDEERAFYSSDTWDVEIISSVFGRIELVGISDRGDYDLSSHMKLSGESMEVQVNERKLVPHVIEVAYGIDRPLYCILESCYREDGRGPFFSLPPDIAPYKCMIFPLVKKDGVDEKAEAVYNALRSGGIYCRFDEDGSIGRRYARADEIGVPWCITVDYDTLKDDTITIRSRDTKEQKRMKVQDLLAFFYDHKLSL